MKHVATRTLGKEIVQTLRAIYDIPDAWEPLSKAIVQAYYHHDIITFDELGEAMDYLDFEWGHPVRP